MLAQFVCVLLCGLCDCVVCFSFVFIVLFFSFCFVCVCLLFLGFSVSVWFVLCGLFCLFVCFVCAVCAVCVVVFAVRVVCVFSCFIYFCLFISFVYFCLFLCLYLQAVVVCSLRAPASSSSTGLHDLYPPLSPTPCPRPHVASRPHSLAPSSACPHPIGHILFLDLA